MFLLCRQAKHNVAQTVSLRLEMLNSLRHVIRDQFSTLKQALYHLLQMGHERQNENSHQSYLQMYGLHAALKFIVWREDHDESCQAPFAK